METKTFHANQISNSKEREDMNKYMGQVVRGHNEESGHDVEGKLEEITANNFGIRNSQTGALERSVYFTPVNKSTPQKDSVTDSFKNKIQEARDITDESGKAAGQPLVGPEANGYDPVPQERQEADGSLTTIHPDGTETNSRDKKEEPLYDKSKTEKAEIKKDRTKKELKKKWGKEAMEKVRVDNGKVE